MAVSARSPFRVRPLVALRAVCLLLAVTATGAAAWTIARPPVTQLASRLRERGWETLRDIPFDELLEAGFAAALLAGAGWLLVVSTVVAASAVFPAWRGLARLSRLCPRGLRGALLTACGLAMTTTLASPAAADRPGGAAPVRVEAQVAGLTLPDRVVVPPGLEPPSRHRHEVTVEPGDSLWHVAERLLGPAAPDRAVAREWREIYALNRDRLGPDPDLIFPGTVLRLPEPTAPDREDP